LPYASIESKKNCMSENKKPTAVVVGATGIIGSAIVAKLSEVGR
jgi:nucleoside-diphosphate-sugar epimerase